MAVIKLWGYVASAALLCQMVSAADTTPSPVNPNLQAVVQASNAFSNSLYQALRNKPGNLVVSPLSAQAVLTMAWLGAGGETARQLAAGLHLPASRPQLEAGFRALLSSLQSTETVKLDIANKMYLQKGKGIKEAYRKSVVDNFRSDVQEVDFAKNTEAARTSINQWVEEKTHDKIKNLIAPGTLDNSALMVLVNAVYFKGGWLKPFDKEDTVVQSFHLNSKTSKNVSMMHKTSEFVYRRLSDLNAKVLQLKYLGESVSMLLLLPDDMDGMGRLEAAIPTLDLKELTSEWFMEEVIVSLPKFKVRKTTELKDVLEQLGMPDVFQPTANFSGIVDESVYVSKAVQKAFVSVSEKGTEAAAATRGDIMFLSAPMKQPPVFKADHPFLFLIREDTTGAILFMGRVMRPT